MPPERCWRCLHPILSGPICRRLSERGGSQGLGKGRIALWQLLEQMQRRRRGMLDRGAHQIADRPGPPFL